MVDNHVVPAYYCVLNVCTLIYLFVSMYDSMSEFVYVCIYRTLWGSRSYSRILVLRGVSMLHEALGGYWDSIMIEAGKSITI